MIAGWAGYGRWQYEQLEPLREGISALKAGNYELALERLGQFAEAGNALAQRQLGFMYALGLGVPADKVQAGIWFRRAECSCWTTGDAEYGVALDYLNGQEVKRDNIMALYWVQRAAEAGNVESQRLLADPTKAAEKGLEVDPSLSEYWRKVAQSQ
jgi:TPR repeat protein